MSAGALMPDANPYAGRVTVFKRTQGSAKILEFQSRGTIEQVPVSPNTSSTELRTTKMFESAYWLGGERIFNPIKAHLEFADGEVLAIEPNTSIHGVGDDLGEALEDLREALSDHLAVLANSGDQLSDQLTSHREWLLAHIIPVS